MKSFLLKSLLSFSLLFAFTFQAQSQCQAEFEHLVAADKIYVTDSTAYIQGGSIHEWNFGDSTVYTTGYNVSNYVHTYSNPGTYIVCLKVMDSLNTCLDSTCVVITAYSSCHAELNVTQPTPWRANIATLSESGGTSPYFEIWDGQGSYMATSSYLPGMYYPFFPATVMAPGTYYPCHVISDSTSNCVDTTCSSYTVYSSNGSCNAYFTYVDTGNMVIFTDSTASISNSKAYFWDFDSWSSTNSSQYNSAPNQIVNYTYPGNGSYRACFTVVDSVNSCQDRYCETIVIGPPTVDASFTVYEYNGIHQFYSNSSSSYGYDYIWDFGDSTKDSTSLTPVHTYANPGAYIACIYIEDTVTLMRDTFCMIVNAGGPQPSNCASFSINQSGSYFQFANTSPCIDQDSYFWDYGDGMLDTGSNVSHTYASSGQYNVTLTVYDSVFYIDTAVRVVNVGPPPVSLCASFNSNTNGLNASFTNTSSCLGQAYYWWKFGDGLSSFAANPTHAYSNSGTYYVTLSVYDSIYSILDSIIDSVVVVNAQNPSCLAYFSSAQALDSNNNLIPGHLVITDSSIGNNLTYFWDFGDGNSSSSQNPSHTYTSNGPYMLCLTVSDSSCSSTYCDTLSVDSNGMISKSGQGFSIHVGGYIETGISALPEKVDFKIYPNPFYDEVVLEFENVLVSKADITILNNLGQVVYLTKISPENKGQRVELNLSALENGIYFVHLQNEGGTVIKKMVKH